MNENMMTTNDNLMHWGIKGQKWGVRRYQNPDGTLTEEGIRRYNKKYPYQNPDGSLNERGQKEYMTAAKKGKIDLNSLPDKELDMINQRFNRENTFKNNVSKYEESTFEYKLKQAVINRIKGGGGGGGKKGKGGGGKKGGITGIGSLLAMPIKKAFEDAFKTTNSGGGGNKDDNKKSAEDEWYEEVKAQRAFVKGYDPRPDKFDADVKRGQEAFWRSMESWKNRDHDRGNNSFEDILRDRSKNRKSDAREDTRPRNMRSLPSGGIYMDPDEYTIHSELMHYGIKGQKWGVRRFQNEDGSLTAEGVKRYENDRQTEKLMKRMTKIDKLDYRDKLIAIKKLSKDKKFQELVDDEDLKTKRSKYKNATDKWFEKSKGEDFDAYTDETGYNDYGITPKQFNEIKKLESKMRSAGEAHRKAVEKKVQSFTKSYANESISKINFSDEEINRINKLLTLAMLGYKDK